MKLTRWFGVLVCAAALGLPASPAAAKSWSIPGVVIQAQVEADGTMTVTESRTFRLAGSFSHGFQDLDLPERSTLSEVAVADASGPYRPDGSKAPGTFTLSGQPYGARLDWYYTAADTDKTFTVHYKVSNAFRLHQDAAELAWHFIGSRWERGHSGAEIRVTLPAEPVRAWLESGRGELAVNGRDVFVPVPRVGAGSRVTIRALLPRSAVIQPGPADAATMAALLQEKKRPFPPWASLAALALAAAAGAVFLVRHVWPYRAEASWEPGPAPPAPLMPAQAARLLASDAGTAFTAEVLDLVRRGAVSVTPATDQDGSVQKWWLERTSVPVDPQVDGPVLDLLFPGGAAQIGLSEWHAWAMQNRDTYHGIGLWYMRLKQSLPGHWYERHVWWPYLLAPGCWFLAGLDPNRGVWLVFAGLALILLGLCQHRLSRAGVTAKAEWLGYRQWLRKHRPAVSRFPDDLTSPVLFAVAAGVPQVLDVGALALDWYWYGTFTDAWHDMYRTYGRSASGSDGGSGGDSGGDGGGGGGVD